MKSGKSAVSGVALKRNGGDKFSRAFFFPIFFFGWRLCTERSANMNVALNPAGMALNMDLVTASGQVMGLYRGVP